MYTPDHFKIEDEEKIREFVGDNNFGELISINNGKPIVTHTAFLFEPSSMTLSLHLARANPHWQALDGAEVLFVANGPHGYISPSWYSSAGVPTWNYQAVHFTGIASTFSEADRLEALVNSLTANSEKSFSEPWQPDYPKSMLRGIVGVEIAITDVECKFKLSQNRSAEDQERSVRELDQTGNSSLARAMEKENRTK